MSIFTPLPRFDKGSNQSLMEKANAHNIRGELSFCSYDTTPGLGGKVLLIRSYTFVSTNWLLVRSEKALANRARMHFALARGRDPNPPPPERGSIWCIKNSKPVVNGTAEWV